MDFTFLTTSERHRRAGSESAPRAEAHSREVSVPRAASSHGSRSDGSAQSRPLGAQAWAGGRSEPTWQLWGPLSPPLPPRPVLHFLPSLLSLALLFPTSPHPRPRPAWPRPQLPRKVQDKHGCPDPTGQSPAPVPPAARQLPCPLRPGSAASLWASPGRATSIFPGHAVPGPTAAVAVPGQWGQGQPGPKIQHPENSISRYRVATAPISINGTHAALWWQGTCDHPQSLHHPRPAQRNHVA